MKAIRRTPTPRLSPRREIIRHLRYLSNDKLEIVLHTIRELDNDALTNEDIAAIEEGKRAVAQGDVISLEQFCKNADL